MKYLIVKPSSLGDIIHVMPAVSALSRYDEAAEIDWLVKPVYSSLPTLLPCVRRIIPFDREKLSHFSSFFSEFFKLVAVLRNERYDVVLDFQGLTRSAFFSRISGAKICVGPKETKEIWAKLFYKKKIYVPVDRKKVHAVDFNNSFLSSFLHVPLNKLDFSVNLKIPDRDIVESSIVKKAGNFSKGMPRRYFTIAVGSRWETKTWPASFFIDIISKLCFLFPQTAVILLGSPSEKKLSDYIVEQVKNPNVISFAGETTLIELVYLIQKSAALICNDSGPMHIAALLQVPVIAFFGPTSPELTGPYSSKKKVFIPNLTCNPCFKHYCKDMKCHQMISSDEVIKAIMHFVPVSN